MAERREKKRNLVLVGVPEKERDKKDQKAADVELIKGICDQMDVDFEGIGAIFRDGHENRFGRIMKVCFKQGFAQDRLSFMRKFQEAAKKVPILKALHRPPFARPDLTFAQRNADKLLRDELKERRNNGEDVIIRKGRIIDRSVRVSENS